MDDIELFYYLLTINRISCRSAGRIKKPHMSPGPQFGHTFPNRPTRPRVPGLTPSVQHDTNQRWRRPQDSRMFEWKWSWAEAQQGNSPPSANSMSRGHFTAAGRSPQPLTTSHFHSLHPVTVNRPPHPPPPPLCCHSAVISRTLQHTAHLQPFTSSNQDVDSSQPLRPIWKFPSQEASFAVWLHEVGRGGLYLGKGLVYWGSFQVFCER